MGGAGIRVEDESDWLQEGGFVHEVGANDLKVWRIANLVLANTGRLRDFHSFDAVCVTTGAVLQHHEWRAGTPKPGGWRIANEMDILGLCAMSPEEYRAWQKAWYQGKGAWHHRDEPK